MVTPGVPCRLNNAGSNAYKYVPLASASDADLINIVETNVLGVMLCCREVQPCALQSARFTRPLIGSPINFADCVIGSPISSQSTGAAPLELSASGLVGFGL